MSQENPKMFSKLNFNNIDRFCNEIDLTSDKPIIDLSEVKFITQFSLVYLGLYIRHQINKGYSLRVCHPKNQQTREYLERQNFFQRLDVNYPGRFVEYLRYSVEMLDIKSDPGLPDEYSEKLKELLVTLRVNTDIPEFCEISSEILDNFVRHSEDQLGLIAF